MKRSALLLSSLTPSLLSNPFVVCAAQSSDWKCDELTAVVTAESALERAKALWLKQHGGDLSSLVGTHFVGIGCTAAIISTAPKRGDHRAHVVCASDRGLWAYNFKLKKGARGRAEEDGVISRLIVRGLLEASGVGVEGVDPEHLMAAGLLPEGCTDGEEVVHLRHVPRGADEQLDGLLSDDQDPDLPCTNLLHVPRTMSPGKGTDAPPPPPSGAGSAAAAAAADATVAGLFASCKNFAPPGRLLVYPGSFNPLHEGR